MKLLPCFVSIVFCFQIFAQDSHQLPDTILAKHYYHLADSLNNKYLWTLKMSLLCDSANYYYQKASDIYRRATALGGDTSNSKLWIKYIQCQNKISLNIAIYKGEITEGLDILNNTLNICIKQLGKEHAMEANTLNYISHVYRIKGEYDKSLECAKKSLSINLKTLIPDHLKIANIYNRIGLIYWHTGDYYTALEYYQQTLHIYLKARGHNHPNVAIIYNNMGNVHSSIEDYEKALELHNLALEIYANEKNHFLVGYTKALMGEVYVIKKKYDLALKYFNDFLQKQRTLLGEDHPDLALASYNLIGNLFIYKGEYHKAIEYFKRSLKILLNVFGCYHPYVGEVYNQFGYIYAVQEKYSEALKYYQYALQSLVKGFEDSNLYVNPVLPTIYQIKEGKSTVNSMPLLLKAIEGKAEGFYQKWKTGA